MTEINIPRQHEKYERLIAAAKTFPPLATAVAYPCDETSLKGAVEAAEAVRGRVGPDSRLAQGQDPRRRADLLFGSRRP